MTKGGNGDIVDSHSESLKRRAWIGPTVNGKDKSRLLPVGIIGARRAPGTMNAGIIGGLSDGPEIFAADPL